MNIFAQGLSTSKRKEGGKAHVMPSHFCEMGPEKIVTRKIILDLRVCSTNNLHWPMSPKRRNKVHYDEQSSRSRPSKCTRISEALLSLHDGLRCPGDPAHTLWTFLFLPFALPSYGLHIDIYQITKPQVPPGPQVLTLCWIFSWNGKGPSWNGKGLGCLCSGA